ncbi:MAG: malto-oligosyltrehalose synthase [Dehalococcoidia bacterium]|nr:malto-oligosyltrehalose synthase [Dehalococcoidia bacterium]
MTRPRMPVATYRLQLNGRFRFEDARALVPYLHDLGISDLYASPILKARRGSLHGYDVTDPTQLNPELGTDEQFDSLAHDLRKRGMGLLLDIVPNHMAASFDNPWWADVLQNGPCSAYAGYFDIDWNQKGSTPFKKVLLPILGRPYTESLEGQELSLILEEDGIFAQYYDSRLPIAVKSYSLILSNGLDDLESELGTSHPAVQHIKSLANAIKQSSSCQNGKPRGAKKRLIRQQIIKEELSRLVNTYPEAKAFILGNVKLINGQKGEPKTFDLLNQLLSKQPYQLAYWKTGVEQINYRRFFDISDLVGVRVEVPRVFAATHKLLSNLIREGKVTGLRIDHIDGLLDPLQYLRRLQHYVGGDGAEQGDVRGLYVVVEKILTGDECLPRQWPVSGTTGYDFTNMVNALFVDTEGMRAIASTYVEITGTPAGFDDEVYERKKQVLNTLFAGETRTLGLHLSHLAEQDRDACSLSLEHLTGAIVGAMACLPVYRTYTRTARVSRRDRRYVERCIGEAKQRDPQLDPRGLDFLRRVLLLDPSALTSAEQRQAWLRFVQRWQQLSGPAMAKGLEDTALYTFNRLVSLNEVGGDAGSMGLSTEDFHRRMMLRSKQWPGTMNTTSTHDTKRGEDVRARINVLSEMPDRWNRCLSKWTQWNETKKRRIGGQMVPDPSMESLLYQTMLGAWPSAEHQTEFPERMKAFAIKAAREAKTFTSWISPNIEYEEGLLAFLDSILEPAAGNRFLADFLAVQKEIAFYGAINSLSQLLIKIASPGVPDFYQGTELWDLSLVDPDNRQPVDFEKRTQLLKDLRHREGAGWQSLLQEILASWQDGRVKFYVTYKALNARRAHHSLFMHGDYVPLKVKGARREHICAFARRNGEDWAVTVAPRLPTRLVSPGTWPLGRRVWGNDVITLPKEAPNLWDNVFTRDTVEASQAAGGIHLARLLGTFPIALLIGTTAVPAFSANIRHQNSDRIAR